MTFGPQVAICVGTTKAGTSWLYKCLEEHPVIAASNGKETNFFLQENVACKDFFSHFSRTKSERLFFESSPKYFSEENAAKNIKDCFPHAKIIIQLRNPVQRTESHIRHFINNGVYDHSTKLEQIKEETPEVIEHSMYEKYVPMYQELFKKENILIIDFDRINTEPQAVINDVCIFLNIETFTPSFLKVKYNTNTARSNPLYLKIRSIYIKFQRYKITKSLLNVLRKIGINSATLEKILSITSGQRARKKINVPKEKLERKLENSLDFYNNEVVERNN